MRGRVCNFTITEHLYHLQGGLMRIRIHRDELLFIYQQRETAPSQE
jgi:hypothetical protein